MGGHEERLVEADGDGKCKDHTQRSDGERLAMVSHGEHVLIKRATDTDVAFNGEDDDDPGRRETEYVRDEPERRTDYCHNIIHGVVDPP